MNDSIVAEAKTMAKSLTSGGWSLRVSVGNETPPARSFLYYDCADTACNDKDDHQNVRRRRPEQLPSLSPLPPRNIPIRQEEGTDGWDPYCRLLFYRDTGLLRRAEDELLVAQLEVMPSFSERQGKADLCVLRHDRSQWVLKRSLPIVHNQGAKGDEQLDCWDSTRVIPVADRYLCWAQYNGSFIMCGMENEESPKIRYIPTPLFPYDPSYYNDDEDLVPMWNSMSMGAAGPSASPPIRPTVGSGNTGLLQRGDDDVLLVQLHLMYDPDAQRDMAEFSLLRRGVPEWELKELVPIFREEGGEGIEQLRTRGGNNTIIPLGDRFLCWVKYESGFLLCDMEDEASPKVSIDPHCCCGGAGKSTCAHSRYAFTINAWVMNNLSMGGSLTWVKDGEMDCEELWRLPGYEGLPQANLMCPVVWLDIPNVICFLVSNGPFVSSYEDRKEWMIQLNIKTKTLLSVVQYSNDSWGAYYHLPTRLQC
ncbi:unnamed protein product [Urochloa decumbens]|uniref:DUF1618 domain-containing protein n=1 Tax=Urochloa decumbens TaxID=240449 RepID=A0ABC9B6I7_9POAL